MASFTIEEVPIPSRPLAGGWAEFAACIAVENIVEAAAYGTEELAQTAVEALPQWLVPEFGPRRLFCALSAGRILGTAMAEMQAVGGDDRAWLSVAVLPRAQGRGIGTALADHVEAVVEADGRTTQYVYTVSPDSPGERLTAPTGFGSVPLANREVRFLLNRGYRLEQVERGSRLELPGDTARREHMLAEARSVAGDAYRVHSWTGHTPLRWREDLALLNTRMSTDAPTAGLAEPEDPWTVDRLVAYEQAEDLSPRIRLTTATEHRATGRLTGFTVLSVPQEDFRAVSQEDTLVLREHRGHRLGMVLKLTNLAVLTEFFPGHPAVITFNAEENRPMLAVNESIGFEPMGYEGAWKRVVA